MIQDHPDRPSGLQQAQYFIGELARPFSIIVNSLATAIGIVIISQKVNSFEGGAMFIAAAFGGVVALYTAKAWENAKKGKHESQVEIAKVNSNA